MEEEGGRYSLEYFSAPRQRFKYVPAMKEVVRQKREGRRHKEEEEGQLGNVSLESNPWQGQSAKRETRTKFKQSLIVTCEPVPLSFLASLFHCNFILRESQCIALFLSYSITPAFP